MPIDLSKLVSHLSLPCSLPQRHVDTLYPLREIKLPFVQRPIMTSQSLVRPVSSVQSQTENRSLASQPMEARSRRSTVTFVVCICRTCLQPDVTCTAWVDPNDEFKPTDDSPPTDHGWCSNCEDECDYDFYRHSSREHGVSYWNS